MQIFKRKPEETAQQARKRFIKTVLYVCMPTVGVASYLLIWGAMNSNAINQLNSMMP